MNDLVKLAIDAHNGSVEKYSVTEAQEALRQALIDANGGDTKIDIRKIRDGKCSEVFAIVEEIIKEELKVAFKDDDFFMALVDMRNVAEGDEIAFEIEHGYLFYVDDISKGNQGIRRQRIYNPEKVYVPTKMHGVRIYEELSRVLAGRVDFNDMIDKVNASVKQAILGEIYGIWSNVTSSDLGGTAYFPAVGSYSEATLLSVIDHVEAAAEGKTATIFGTKKALRSLSSSISHEGTLVKNDMYENGYIGKFFGSPVVVVPQRHKVGTTTFNFDDNEITVIATGDKPIKFVTEGDPLIIPRDATANADLTQEYFLGEQWGTAFVMASNNGIGKYKFS